MASPSGSSPSAGGVPAYPPQGQQNTLAPPIVPDVNPDQKAFPIHTSHGTAKNIFSFADPIVQPISHAISSLQASREKLNLPNPGTIEHLTREVKGTHLTNFIFDGARADLTKALSINPIFQVTHALSAGQSEGKPSYNFGAVYGSGDSFFQGGVDDGGSVTMRANRRLFPGHIAKVQGQITSPAEGRSFVQLEHDYQGTDHSINLKAMNPSPADGTGIYMVNYLQSLTKNFALGLETVYMRPSVDQREANTGYMAKYTSTTRDIIATLQLQGSGIAQATYWHKLAERVEAAVDLQTITAAGRREAQATAGAKWDFRNSTLRAQIDSTGKLSSVFENRLAPTFAFTVAGEIDHFKGSAAKFGVGISIESAGDLPMDPNAPPPAPPSVPM
ncbi:unnamed protein product [Sympodiomycopsis kandeliae]